MHIIRFFQKIINLSIIFIVIYIMAWKLIDAILWHVTLWCINEKQVFQKGTCIIIIPFKKKKTFHMTFVNAIYCSTCIIGTIFPPSILWYWKIGESSFPKISKISRICTRNTKNLQLFLLFKKNHWSLVLHEKMQFLNLRRTLQVLHISGCGVDLKMQEKTI